jgi:hypothetical protein
MTSGNNVIPAMSATSGSSVGAAQFGLNLRNNSDPSVGAEVSGSGTGSPATGYGTVNQFRFVSGERVAMSSLPSDFNRYTASYIVNIPEDQPPGVYSTTVSYSAVVSF